MPSSIVVKTLSDEPADKDAFGSHERIAAALATVINAEVGGKAIALTGTWGSGKSTVIRLLRQRQADLDKARSSSTLIFEFDAWAHEGDSLRRTFLESLGAELRAVGWISEEYWEETRWHLSHKEDQSVTTSRPNLTPWGIALSVSLLLVPLGYALIRLIDTKVGLWDQAIWYAVVGCIGAPAAVAAMAWLIGKRSAPQVTTLFGKKHISPPGFADVFLEHRNTVTHGTTVRGPDPTSVEFELIYGEMVASALIDSRHHLCIVIDNLDRLEPSEVVTVWSTLRVFFGRPSGQQPNFVQRFWIIAAFDRLVLQRRMMTEGAAPPLDGLLDKTFDLIFRVPEPPLLSWRQYLQACFVEALPDYPKHDVIDDVAYAFDRLRPIHQEVTPRQIKRFVNRLGVSVRQWGEEPPLITQAVYVLTFADDPDAILNLQKREFLPTGILATLSPSAREDIVRLHFMADAGRAAYLLWGDRIKTSVRTGPLDSLHDLFEMEGFRLALQQSLAEDLSPAKASSIVEYARLIEEIDKTKPVFGTESFWRLLQAHCGPGLDWDISGRRVVRGLEILIKHSNGSAWPRILRSLAKATHKDQLSAERLHHLLWTAEEFYQNLQAPFRELKLPYEERFRLDLPPGELIGFLSNATWIGKTNDRQSWVGLLQISRQTATETVAFLAKACAEKDLPDGSSVAVTWLQLLLRGQIDWRPLNKALGERLAATDTSWARDVPTMLRLAARLNEHSDYAPSPSVLWRWVRASASSDLNAAAVAELLREALSAPVRSFSRSPEIIQKDDVSWIDEVDSTKLNSIITDLVTGGEYEERQRLRESLKQHDSLSHLYDLVLRRAVDLGGLWVWVWIETDDFLGKPESFARVLGEPRLRKAVAELRSHELDWAFNEKREFEPGLRVHSLANFLRLQRVVIPISDATASTVEGQSDAAAGEGITAASSSLIPSSGDEEDGTDQEAGIEPIENKAELRQDKLAALLLLYAQHLLEADYVAAGAAQDVTIAADALDSSSVRALVGEIVTSAESSSKPLERLLKGFGPMLVRHVAWPEQIVWLTHAFQDVSDDVVRSALSVLESRDWGTSLERGALLDALAARVSKDKGQIPKPR